MPRQRSKSPQPVQSYRTVEFKLYPNKSQEETLSEWLRQCCRVYNRTLEHRTKAWKRRKESVSFVDQCRLLTMWRAADPRLNAAPVEFERDALRRVDRGMQGFFRRVKAKQTPGFPRFRTRERYRTLEVLASYAYVRSKSILIPKLGPIRARGPFSLISDKVQSLLRVIQRASGWYVQVLTEHRPQPLPSTGQVVGIDVGITDLVVTDTNQKFGNPKLLRKSAKKLRAAQKTLSRRRKGSNRRKKAVLWVGKVYERIQRQRRGLAHEVSRELVNRYDAIAHENLNLKGLCRGWLRKSVYDAAWAQLLRLIAYKAENAGRQVIAVDPRGTSQECPTCGRIAPKKLSERVHSCPCGLQCDRDHAAALVIRRRGFSPGRGDPVRPGSNPGLGP